MIKATYYWNNKLLSQMGVNSDFLGEVKEEMLRAGFDVQVKESEKEEEYTGWPAEIDTVYGDFEAEKLFKSKLNEIHSNYLEAKEEEELILAETGWNEAYHWSAYVDSREY